MIRQLGTVIAFDADAGLGVVRLDGSGGGEPGVRDFSFHCTTIADGSRTVAVGTRVSVTVVPGRMGRYEAADLRPG